MGIIVSEPVIPKYSWEGYEEAGQGQVGNDWASRTRKGDGYATHCAYR
jgi:hypothetical protein